MEVCFDCTQCGRCCHDLRLTLSFAEARVWAGNGHRVELLAEAWPWPDTGNAADPALNWRRETSFAAHVGDVPFRITLRLVARHAGPCPHLMPDMRCGNYAARPRICRIYPLESRPFEAMQPERRLCPPEAWMPGLPVLARGGEPARADARAIIAAHRQAMVDDVAIKAALAAVLGFAEAAMAGEGLAVCDVAPDALLAAMDRALAQDAAVAPDAPNTGGPQGPGAWSIVTNRETTRAMLAELGCPARLVAAGFGFLPAFADQG